jgi:hypothetical protein
MWDVHLPLRFKLLNNEVKNLDYLHFIKCVDFTPDDGLIKCWNMLDLWKMEFLFM